MPRTSTRSTPALFGATLAAWALLMGSAQAQDKLTLRVADSLPVDHYIARAATTNWMEAVTRLTDGRVEFEYFPAGQLGGASDMLSMLEAGVADVTYMVPAYLSQRLPLSMVANLPADYTHPCVGTQAYWTLAQEGGALWENELKPLGIRPVFALMLPPNQIVTAQPFSTLAELEGLKLRTSSAMVDLYVRALNGVPLQIPAAEMYQALSRRTIDGLVMPPISMVPYDLQTVTRSATFEANLGGFIVTYAIMEKTWAALPDDIREAMAEAGRETTERACEIVADESEAVRTRIIEAGVAPVELSDEDRAELNRVAENIGDQWAAEMEALGKPGTLVLNAFEEALQ